LSRIWDGFGSDADHPVAAGLLRTVEGLVGQSQQGDPIVGLIGRRCDPDRYGARQGDGEFLAAVARDR
jgi:hypothetical protein